jgi:hypothetical protein
MASVLILSRLITENTGGPLSSSLGLASPMSRVAASKAACTFAMAMACASRSLPAARVVAIISARGAVRDIHTPSSLRGALAGTSSIGDALRLAGRVAVEKRLDHVAGRRAEHRQRLVDRVAQALGGEAAPA